MKRELYNRIIDTLMWIGICGFLAGFIYPLIFLVYLLYFIGRLFILKYIEKNSCGLKIIIALLIVGPISGVAEYLDYLNCKGEE